MMASKNTHELILSRLDFVHVYEVSDAVVSFANTTEAVKLADELGFLRHWFAGL